MARVIPPGVIRGPSADREETLLKLFGSLAENAVSNQGYSPQDMVSMLRGEDLYSDRYSEDIFPMPDPMGSGLSLYDKVLASVGNPMEAQNIVNQIVIDERKLNKDQDVIFTGSDSEVYEQTGLNKRELDYLRAINNTGNANVLGATETVLNILAHEQPPPEALKDIIASIPSAYGVTEEELLEQIQKQMEEENLVVRTSPMAIDDVLPWNQGVPASSYNPPLGGGIPPATTIPIPATTPTPTATPTSTPTPIATTIPTPIATPTGNFIKNLKNIWENATVVNEDIDPYGLGLQLIGQTAIDEDTQLSLYLASQASVLYGQDENNTWKILGQDAETDENANLVFGKTEEEKLVFNINTDTGTWDMPDETGKDEIPISMWGKKGKEEDISLGEDTRDLVEKDDLLATFLGQPKNLWRAVREEQLGPKMWNPFWKDTVMHGYIPTYGSYLYNATGKSFADYLKNRAKGVYTDEVQNNAWENMVLASKELEDETSPFLEPPQDIGGTPKGSIFGLALKGVTDTPSGNNTKNSQLAMVSSRMGIDPMSHSGNMIYSNLENMYDRFAARQRSRGKHIGGFLAWADNYYRLTPEESVTP